MADIPGFHFLPILHISMGFVHLGAFPAVVFKRPFPHSLSVSAVPLPSGACIPGGWLPAFPGVFSDSHILSGGGHVRKRSCPPGSRLLTEWVKLFFCEVFKGYFPLPPFIPVTPCVDCCIVYDNSAKGVKCVFDMFLVCFCAIHGNSPFFPVNNVTYFSLVMCVNASPISSAIPIDCFLISVGI